MAWAPAGIPCTACVWPWMCTTSAPVAPGSRRSDRRSRVRSPAGRRTEVGPYRPGLFYRRELPPLRAVVGSIAGLGLLVVDGYADLDPDGRPGLSAHAHAKFGIPVIGVAKTGFRTATHAVPVLRGTSARPVFVSAAGMRRADAAALVRLMAGRFRVPDALRRADQLARTGPQAALQRSHHPG